MIRRPVTAAAAAVLSVAVLTGCGVGQNAQTYQARIPSDSINTSVGSMQIRNLHVQAPTDLVLAAGGNASVVGTFVNEATQSDSLLSVSTDAAPIAVLKIDGKLVSRVTVPSRGQSPGTMSIALQGLTQELHPGTYITVTLNFAQAGRIDVSIPIRANLDSLENREPPPTENAEHVG